MKTVEFDAGKAGKNLLVLGAVHGNEVCGPKAMARLMSELERGEIVLASGKLVMIPVCNERAYAQNVRYVEENLNRVFVKHDTPRSYEAGLANEIIPYVEACDVMLDIHSFHTPGAPFVFQDSVAAKAFAAAMQFPLVMTGWPDIYADAADKNEGDTVGYALAQGKEAILIECGQHEDAAAVGLAYQALRQALVYTGLMAGEVGNVLSTFIHMEKVVFKEREGVLSRAWAHGDAVKAGEVIGVYEDGEKLLAEADGFVLLPSHAGKVGDEWFYVGREV